MSASSIILVLLAAVVHALWNRAFHVAGDRLTTMAIANLVGGIVLTPALIARPPTGVGLWIALSVAAQAAYAGALAAAYQRGSLTVTYPIARGTSPLIVTFAAWALLDQQPSAASALGAVALFAGLCLLALAGRRVGERSAVVWALATGACIASYSTVDARAVQDADPSAYLAVVMYGAAVVLAAARRPTRTAGRAALRSGVAVGLGSTAAYLLVLFAFQRAGAGNVTTLRETSVLFAAVLAGERLPGGRLAGAGLIAAGAILAAAG